MQTSTPDDVLGRVSAAFCTSDAIAAVAGALIAPAVVALTGLGEALIAFSAVVAATAVLAIVALPAADTEGTDVVGMGRQPWERHRQA